MTKEQVFVAKGKAPWFSNNWLDINKVISMNKLDSGTTVVCDGSVTDTTEMFHNCNELTSIDLSNFDVSNVVYMSGMFYYCFRITALDLSNFDTSNTVFMAWMFAGCEKLTTIKGVINMKSCEDCYNMFKNCPNLSGVKIKNPPSDFEAISGLSKSQYTVVS